MNFCPKCGNQLGGTAKFCGSCGSPVAQSSNQFSPSENRLTKIPRDDVAEIAKTVFVIPTRILGGFKVMLQRLGLTPLDIVGGDDPAQLQTLALRRIRAAFDTERLAYVCIIGDWSDVLPFRLDNPISHRDGDEHCISDAPYGYRLGIDSSSPFDPLSYIPEVPVGRIPTTSLNTLEQIFQSAKSSTDALESFQFAVTAECWKEATESIVEQFTNRCVQIQLSSKPSGIKERKNHLLSSPEWDRDSLEKDLATSPLQSDSLILFNVHGSGDITTWFGEGVHVGMPEIFHPSTINNFKNGVVVSEACYGGALSYDEPSVVEQFFTNGGRAFVGCSVIAYGTPDDSLCGADLIALNFIKALQEGFSFGDALNHAKFETSISNPECDEISLKTVMSFNLFGLPWQQFSSSSKSRLGATQESPSVQINVADRLRARMDVLRNKISGSLSGRREEYRSRLPEKLRRSMVDKEQFLRDLASFKDFRKIQTTLERMDSSLNDCRFEHVESDQFSGFQISGESRLPYGAMQTFMIITDADGSLKKTIVSKGKKS